MFLFCNRDKTFGHCDISLPDITVKHAEMLHDCICITPLNRACKTFNRTFVRSRICISKEEWPDRTDSLIFIKTTLHEQIL